MIYIGIDPGSMWCGFAQLTVEGDTYTAETGVLCVEGRRVTFKKLIDQLIPKDHTWDLQVICEAYQHRAQGHQRWSPAMTAQIIGALRYRAEAINAQWATVPPMSPTQPILRELVIGRYLERWEEWWPRRASPKWEHARSAWRVLAQYLLMRQSPDLSRLRLKVLPPVRPLKDVEPRVKGYVRGSNYSLVAPVATWRLPPLPPG